MVAWIKETDKNTLICKNLYGRVVWRIFFLYMEYYRGGRFKHNCKRGIFPILRAGVENEKCLSRVVSCVA